jgi:hypothetical protein
MTFKEWLIRPTPNGFLPQLPLNGKWLEKIGFTDGCGVRVTFENSRMILTLDNNCADLMVECRKVAHHPRTFLIVHAFWLKKYGFNLWDSVGLTLEYGRIQVQKIPSFTTDECECSLRVYPF